MARWVLHPEVLDEIPSAPLLNELGDMIVADAIRYAPELTGDLKGHIHKTDVAGDRIEIVADPVHPDEPGDEGHYGYWVEVGTSDTRAVRYLEKALYKKRNP